MADNKRLANIELLRIFAMVMVIVMHFLRESGNLLSNEQVLTATGTNFLATLLEAFCIVAVNVYVLISGYFGVESRYKPSKAIAFLCQIWFYSLLIPLVLTCLGVSTQAERLGIYGLISYLLPIETESYWFATAYFLLLFMMPVLNPAVKAMSKKQLQITLAGLLILFCGIKSVSPIALAFDRYGYDLSWFICLYLVAAYVRRFGAGIFEKHGWKIYGISCLAIFFMTAGLWQGIRYAGGISYYFTVPFHYNFILCLTGALGLFCAFLKLPVKEGKAAKLFRKGGTLCFGIYLLHEHVDIRYQWYPFLKGLINPKGNTGMLPFLTELLFCAAILFLAGILLDWLRSVLFCGAGKVCRATGLYSKIEALDLAFSSYNSSRRK